jgi:hypothetical protein
MGLLDLKSRKGVGGAASSPFSPGLPLPAVAQIPRRVEPHAAPEPPEPPSSRSLDLQPDPARIGLVVFQKGRPFTHYCQICGAWGFFGLGVNLNAENPGKWFCLEHRPEW